MHSSVPLSSLRKRRVLLHDHRSPVASVAHLEQVSVALRSRLFHRKHLLQHPFKRVKLIDPHEDRPQSRDRVLQRNRSLLPRDTRGHPRVSFIRYQLIVLVVKIDKRKRLLPKLLAYRSEERRVGKEGRTWV